MDINLPDVLAEVTRRLRALRRRAGQQRRRRCSTSCSGTARTPCATASPRTSTATTRSAPSAPRARRRAWRATLLQHRHHHLRPRLRHRQHRVPRDGSAKTGRQSQTWMRTARRLARGRRPRQPARPDPDSADEMPMSLQAQLVPSTDPSEPPSTFNRRDSLKSPRRCSAPPDAAGAGAPSRRQARSPSA